MDCIRRRVAIRSFTKEPVPDSVMLKILEAGRWAPSSKNSQPWHFIVVRERRTLESLSRLTTTGPHLATAPVAIAVATIGAKMPQTDAARAIQNMVLVAWDLGVGTCWITNFNQEEAKRLLNLPEEAVFITAMPFGYPDPSEARRKKRRKPLEEIVHWERYGRKKPS